MQTHVDLSEVSLKTNAIEPMWLPLYGERTGQRVEEGLGELKVALWLSPAGQLGRLQPSEHSRRVWHLGVLNDGPWSHTSFRIKLTPIEDGKQREEVRLC